MWFALYMLWPEEVGHGQPLSNNYKVNYSITMINEHARRNDNIHHVMLKNASYAILNFVIIRQRSTVPCLLWLWISTVVECVCMFTEYVSEVIISLVFYFHINAA